MNSKITMILRLVLGLILLVFGLNKFLHFLPMPPMEGDAAEFMGALGKAGYFPILGILEIGIGLLLVMNKWIGLALVALAPIVVNFLIYHFAHDIAGTGPAAIVAILTIVLIYANWGRFKTLF